MNLVLPGSVQHFNGEALHPGKGYQFSVPLNARASSSTRASCSSTLSDAFFSEKQKQSQASILR